MYWDDLCKTVEKKSNDMSALRKILQQTKLFFYEDKSTNPKPLTMEDIENFRLPFKYIAIENERGVTVFCDTVDDQVGFSQPRFFFKVAYNYPAIGHKKNQPKDMLMLFLNATIPDKENWVAQDNQEFEEKIFGVEEEVKRTPYLGGAISTIPYNFSEINYSQIQNFKMGFSMWDNEIQEAMNEYPEMIQNFRYMMEDINNDTRLISELLNKKNFIMEITPKKVRDVKKSPKIPRHHERPLYTLLEPDKIRKEMGLTIEDRAGPRPHERRGHYMVLKNKRYGKNIGKRIWRKSMWIGDSEAKVGNKFYKVLLD